MLTMKLIAFDKIRLKELITLHKEHPRQLMEFPEIASVLSAAGICGDSPDCLLNEQSDMSHPSLGRERRESEG